MGIEQTPIIKRFYASPLAGGTKEAFFDLKDRIDEVVRTQKFLMESGRYEDLAAYMKENGKLIYAKSWVSNTEKELKNVRELIRATSNLTERNITPEEKREALNSLRRSENYLTEQSRTLKKSLMK
jgi:predicted Zn-dependent peptidase